jgi:hypothetical protein
MSLNINIANSCNIIVVRGKRYNPSSTQADLTIENVDSGFTYSTTMAYDSGTGNGEINIPVDNLDAGYGVFKITVEEGGQTYATLPILIKCDIDCCLAKLTNELVDCSCDCPRCAKSLAKAQKVFLLLQSAISQVDLASYNTTVNASVYYTEMLEKYKKAREICDDSCGCDC